MQIDYFKKLVKVITRPKSFFEDIEKESSFGPVLVFLIISLLLAGVIGSIVNIIVIGFLWQGIFLAFVYSIVGFILFNISLLIVHLFVLFCGGRQGLLRTYQSLIYGMAPGLVLFQVPIIYYFANLYSLFLQIAGLRILQKMTLWQSIYALIAIPILIVISIVVLGLILGMLLS
jgi:hypothetical protein